RQPVPHGETFSVPTGGGGGPGPPPARGLRGRGPRPRPPAPAVRPPAVVRIRAAARSGCRATRPAPSGKSATAERDRWRRPRRKYRALVPEIRRLAPALFHRQESILRAHLASRGARYRVFAIWSTEIDPATQVALLGRGV